MEVQIERERKNPVHKALVLLLTHLAVHQPEVAPETKKLQGEIDELFAHEIDWQEAAAKQQPFFAENDPAKQGGQA